MKTGYKWPKLQLAFKYTECYSQTLKTNYKKQKPNFKSIQIKREHIHKKSYHFSKEKNPILMSKLAKHSK